MAQVVKIRSYRLDQIVLSGILGSQGYTGIVMGVHVEGFDAVQIFRWDFRHAVAEGMGLNEHVLVIPELAGEFRDAHIQAVVGGGKEFPINAKEQVVVDIFGKTDLAAQDHVYAVFLAGFCSQIVVGQIGLQAFLFVIPETHIGIKVIADHNAVIAESGIPFYGCFRRNLAAAAGGRSV